MTTNIIKIGNHLVGGNFPPYILAEIGINHGGDAELAIEMIDAAKDAGAHGVKFQTFRANKLVNERISPGQAKYFGQFELNENEFKYLRLYADTIEIDFISTPFDLESLHFLVSLGVPAIKIASGDLTYIPLLKAANQTKLPLIISTGMATFDEIKNNTWFINMRNVIMLHCVSLYPTQPHEANLAAIQYLQNYYHYLPIGYSDHTIGMDACRIAVSMGACFIEKHFTLDRTQEGTDHELAADPQMLKDFIDEIPRIWELRGDGIKKPQEREMEKRYTMRRNPIDWLRPFKRD